MGADRGHAYAGQALPPVRPHHEELEGTSYFNYSKSNIVEMQALFERDNHESWPAFNDQEGEEEAP